MAKIPKGLRKNLNTGRGNRPSRAAGGGAGGKMGSRSMRRAMEQMGIDMDQIDATEVIIKCSDHAIVISDPQVSLINQAGQEIYQVLGTSEKVPLDDLTEELGFEESGIEDEEGMDEAETETAADELVVEVTPQDVQLVMAQTNCSQEQAQRALQDAGGDLARAIMDIKARNP